MTLGVIPLSTVPVSAVIHLAVNILSQHSSPPNLHEAAADCLINLLTRLEREEVRSLTSPILPSSKVYLKCSIKLKKVFQTFFTSLDQGWVGYPPVSAEYPAAYPANKMPDCEKKISH